MKPCAISSLILLAGLQLTLKLEAQASTNVIVAFSTTVGCAMMGFQRTVNPALHNVGAARQRRAA